MLTVVPDPSFADVSQAREPFALFKKAAIGSEVARTGEGHLLADWLP